MDPSEEDTLMGDSSIRATTETNNGASMTPSGTPLPPSLLSAFQPEKIPSIPPTDTYVAQENLPPPLTNDVGAVLTNSSHSQSAEDSLESTMSESSVKGEEIVPHGLPVASLSTGYCYDDRMRFHCEVQPQHEYHPEDPRRILYIYKELLAAGLIDDKNALKPVVGKPMVKIEAKEATKEDICLVHTEPHFGFVEGTKTMRLDDLLELERTRDSIYFNNLSFEAALLSCGGAIEVCRAVANREVKNAIAIIRPPGHHAEVNEAMGFCLFNNVCVAARVCQRDLGDKCRKVMILDWDVHHGNGTQRAFYNDPNILYISIHVYADGAFYPGSPDGNSDKVGEGPGLGKNVNIPWRSQGMGDADYMLAFQQIVMPIAYEFDPDLVIISAGFDAAAGDELGGCFVTPTCYAHMTQMLMNLSNGKVAVCLEGGYNFRSISKSALAVARTLMGEPPDRLAETAPTKSAVEVVREVILLQSKHWRSLYPKAPEGKAFGARLHDMIRQLQANDLYREHKMISLYIYHDKLSESFENQVLATANFDKAQTLVVIFHDPPELMGVPDASTSKMELHQTWLADSVKDYIAWAASSGFGVIDVNIPKHITGQERYGNDEDERLRRITMASELAVYLWENYIEPNDQTDIIFFGVGEAFYGLTELLNTKDQVYQRITGVISFVSENAIRAVYSNTNPWLTKWYRDHSLVYVANTHFVWTSAAPNQKKPSKRYGALKRSTVNGFGEMLATHREEVQEWILERVGEEESSSSGGEDTKMR